MILNFFVENRDGKVRTGVKTKPALPISGDVQMKVGKKLITYSVSDTPLDVTPEPITLQGNDHLAESMQQLTSNITKLGSPYRAFEGKKAKDLIDDLIKHNGLVKMRSIGINKANSTTGEFIIDESFVKALKACGIES